MRVVTVSGDLGKFKEGDQLQNTQDIAEYIRLRVNAGRDHASFTQLSDRRIREAVTACVLPDDADPRDVETDIVSRVTKKEAAETACNGDSDGEATEPDASPAQRGGKLPDAVLIQLAELGHIPAGASRQTFFDTVRSAVHTAHELTELAKQGKANEKGARLRDAAVALYEELRDLNSDDCCLLEDIRIDESRQSLYQLASLFSIRTGKPPPDQAPRSSKIGRAKGSVNNWGSQHFLDTLCGAAALAGGEFTKAGMTKALKVLVPYLPDNFVAPSGSTLQRLKDANSILATVFKFGRMILPSRL